MADKNANWIPFDPAETDVVSSKVRTYNLRHPGNMYYVELVHKMVPELQSDDPLEYKRVATMVVEAILERGGRFLKLKDGDIDPTRCMLMDKKASVNKATHAVRTAQSRQVAGTSLVDYNAAKKKKQMNVTPTKRRDSTSCAVTESKYVTPRSRSRRFSNVVVYEAKQGNQPIYKYGLDLITAVCNQPSPTTAHRVLDTPINGYTQETEPDKERLMRLQIRHRFASASGIGMSPLEYARKLLQLWGGTLAETKGQKKAKSPKAKTTPTSDTKSANSPHAASSSLVGPENTASSKTAEITSPLARSSATPEPVLTPTIEPGHAPSNTDCTNNNNTTTPPEASSSQVPATETLSPQAPTIDPGNASDMMELDTTTIAPETSSKPIPAAATATNNESNTAVETTPPPPTVDSAQEPTIATSTSIVPVAMETDSTPDKEGDTVVAPAVSSTLPVEPAADPTPALLPGPDTYVPTKDTQ